MICKNCEAIGSQLADIIHAPLVHNVLHGTVGALYVKISCFLAGGHHASVIGTQRIAWNSKNSVRHQIMLVCFKKKRKQQTI